MKKMLVPGVLGLVTSIMLGGAAMAKDGPVRGTIASVSGSALVLTENDGTKLSVTMLPAATVIDVVPGSLSEVKAGTYVGTAALKQPDGTYRAMELQIFPASMKGLGLGTRPWNLQPHSTMTNGTVGGMTNTGGMVGSVTEAGAVKLQVNDGSGMKTVLLPPTAPIVTFVPGSMSDLVVGAHVMLFPTKAADGTVTISRINVGKNGLVPPM